jgi:hypothetical protein
MTPAISLPLWYPRSDYPPAQTSRARTNHSGEASNESYLLNQLASPSVRFECIANDFAITFPVKLAGGSWL